MYKACVAHIHKEHDPFSIKLLSKTANSRLSIMPSSARALRDPSEILRRINKLEMGRTGYQTHTKFSRNLKWQLGYLKHEKKIAGKEWDITKK